MTRTRTLWMSSMLIVAMAVQAFGFVGSAGANQTIEISDVQKTSSKITITYKKSVEYDNGYFVKVKVNGKEHSKISYTYNWRYTYPETAVVITDLPTADSLNIEIASEYWDRGAYRTGTYVTTTVNGPFVRLDKRDPVFRSVQIEGPRENNVAVAYDGFSSADHYYVQLLQNGSIIQSSGPKYTQTHTFTNVQPGNYSLRVQTAFKDGDRSNWVTWNNGDVKILELNMKRRHQRDGEIARIHKNNYRKKCFEDDIFSRTDCYEFFDLTVYFYNNNRTDQEITVTKSHENPRSNREYNNTFVDSQTTNKDFVTFTIKKEPYIYYNIISSQDNVRMDDYFSDIWLYKAGTDPMFMQDNKNFYLDSDLNLTAEKSFSQAGWMAYGPYQKFPVGKYWVHFYYSSKYFPENVDVGQIDAYDYNQNKILDSNKINCCFSRDSKGMIFDITNPNNLMEFRLYWYGNETIKTKKIIVSRRSL